MGESQAVKRLMQSQEVIRPLNRFFQKIVELNSLSSTAAFETTSSASPIDQYSSHRFRRSGKEVPSVLPRLKRRLVDQTYVRLVDECGRLKRCIRRFIRQPGRREFLQFFVNERQQIFRRRRLPCLDLLDNP